MAKSQWKGTAYLSLALLLGAALGWTARGMLDDIEDDVRIRAEPEDTAAHEFADEVHDEPKSVESEEHSSSRRDLATATQLENWTAETSIEKQQESATVPPAPASNVVRQPIPVSDAHASIIYNQSTRDEATGERRIVRDVLESEAKDDGWSYFMEQTLQMFIAGHSDADKFSIYHIECRTSMCEIQAIGFDESTSPDWSRVLYDMSLQPWYDFGRVGTSVGNYQGQLALLTRLTRTKGTPPAEQGG